MSMFEDFTYDKLMEEALERAPDDLDTRPGSVFYDAIAGAMIKIERLYQDIEFILSLGCIDTATYDALDTKASEYGITRKQATAAKYEVSWTGTDPEIGDSFFYNNNYFTLTYEDGTYYLTASEGGTAANGITSGTAAVPVNDIEGLESITFGDCVTYGTSKETDDSLRDRVKDKVSGPAENGNQKQYESWCESITGVYKAVIDPLWDGPNTVRAILIAEDGQAPSDSVIAEVQEYVDPATSTKTITRHGQTYEIPVGGGLGLGAAPLGAHFSACGIFSYGLSISFNAENNEGVTDKQVYDEAMELLTDYFEAAALEKSTSETKIKINSIAAVLSTLTTCADFSDLSVDGKTSGYISIESDEIGAVGTLSVNGYSPS